MALTTEQEAQIAFEKAMETARAESRAAERAKDQKLEAIRIAQNIVLENSRNAVSDTPITASDLTAIATELTSYINE